MITRALSLALPLASLLATAPAAALAQDVGTSPPPAPFAAVSELVELPDFLPGIGQLFVDPATLPAGPFLAYDREGALVSTVYMIPIAALSAETRFDELTAPGGAVDHVDIYYNAGHPGVEEPHAHVVLWHVADESRVAE